LDDIFLGNKFHFFHFFWPLTLIAPPDGSQQVAAASCRIRGKSGIPAAPTYAASFLYGDIGDLGLGGAALKLDPPYKPLA
jgi:hypothetical protein